MLKIFFLDGEVQANASSDRIPAEVLDEVLYLEHHFNQLGDDWIPECEYYKKPFVGQVFQSIDSAFNFYVDYGRISGFDCRRSTERKDKNKITVGKYFVCSRAGTADNLSSEEYEVIGKRRTVSAKCNYNAKMIIESSGGESLAVKTFIEKHNYSFTAKGGMQFLRCSISLSEFHKRFILDAAKLNIGAARAHAIFKTMIGTYENVAAIVVDFKNFS